MDDFLLELYFFATEGMSAPVHSPEYRRAAKHYEQLEQQVLKKTGFELLQSYQVAEQDLFGWESKNSFYRGLRFGVQFMLAVLPPQSSQTSAP